MWIGFAIGFYLAVMLLLFVMAICAGPDEPGWWIVPIFWPLFVAWAVVEAARQ